MLFSLSFAIYTLLSFRGSAGLYLFQKKEYSDLLPGNGHSGFLLGMSISTTVYQCALQCDSKVNCKSLFFNTDLTQCYTYSKDFGSDLTTDSVNNVNTRYFAVDIRSVSGGGSSSAAVAVTNTVNPTTIPPPLGKTTTAGIPTTTTSTTVNHITTTKVIVATTEPETTTVEPYTTIPVAATTESVCPSVSVPSNDECTNLGYIRSGPYCYMRALTEVKFPTAKSECTSISGMLLVVDSDEEMACIKAFTVSGTYYKIGLEYLGSTWKHTETGEEATYLPWKSLPSPQDDTVIMTNYQYVGWSSTLQNYYICEFDQYFLGNPVSGAEVSVDTTSVSNMETTTIGVQQTTQATCPTVSVPNDGCTDNGYTRVGPYCYKRFLSEVEFSEAMSQCTTISGTVLVVNSDEEMACVKDFTLAGTYYKIGLERDSGSTWKTAADGHVETYLPWKTGEPAASPQCVVMTAWEYIAWTCSRRNYFICEFSQYQV